MDSKVLLKLGSDLENYLSEQASTNDYGKKYELEIRIQYIKSVIQTFEILQSIS